MVKAKVVSDRPAKAKCKEWLAKNGFTDIKPAKNQNCDLIGKKSGKTYYIEIKYSSKETGNFFGTVMLTEMFQAICNKDNYLFLVCRGRSGDINQWFFKLFSVEEFMKCCTLTTPIFLYHLDPKGPSSLVPPKFRETTALASDELVRKMWEDFQRWKSQTNSSREGN